jgi:16S rRNA (cytosine967-C5)-methyltransferase
MTDTINTRELIMNILLEMDREKTPCHLAVRDALDKYQFLPRQDRAFIKRVCEGTVEYGIQNDYIINQYSKIKINKCKPVIRAILRMSVYQIRFLDAVPDSAVVNEAVKLAEKKHFYNLKGFVNGVLRTIVREKDHLPIPKENNTTQYLSVKYSMPEFLVEEFVSQYGKETAETMMADFLKEKQVTIRINRWNNTIEETKKSLESQGAELEKAPYLGEAFYLKNFETIASLNAFQEGRFQIQDVSSMMASHLADPKPGDQVLDLCAAPGGKSLHAADKMRNQGCVEARDLTEYKVDLIRENVQRAGVSCVVPKVKDAEQLDAEWIGKADVVIADLPCTGYGVIGRKPDIKYYASKEKEEELVRIQRAILANAASYVKPGGTLLYSTCTVNRKENSENAAWFLEQFPFEAVSLDELLPDELKSGETAKGQLQLIPGVHKTDGFFLAKFRKTEEGRA